MCRIKLAAALLFAQLLTGCTKMDSFTSHQAFEGSSVSDITPSPTQSPAQAPAPAPLPAPSPEVAHFLSHHEQIKADHFAGKFGVRENPVGWWEGWYLRAYIDMYEGSRDVRILDKLNELLRIVYDGNDLKTGLADEVVGKVMPGWGNTYRGSYGPVGGLRHSDHTLNGLYMYPLAAFARIVKQNPDLKRFEPEAILYLELIEKIFDAFAHDTVSEGPYPDGTVGEYHRYPANYYETYDGRQEFYGGMEKPINLTLVPAEAYAEAYRATGKTKFSDHASRVGNYLWWNMQYGTNGSVTWLDWYYWPAAPAGLLYWEDVSHGALTAKFTTTLYLSKIPGPWSSSTRLNYLANTFKYSIMTDSASMRWRMNDPSSPAVEAKDAYVCADWLSLTPHDLNSGSSLYVWCENIMKQAGLKKESWLPVYALFYRYKP